MTSTNVNRISEAVSAFLGLDIDDRLGVLASLYTNLGSSIPANAKDVPAQDVTNLVAQVEKLSPEEQVSALRDLLPAERTDQDAVMLDPNPSKALGELVGGGGTKIPTHQYGSMNAESKLAFWYSIAQKLGSSVVGIPNDYQLTGKATQALNLLEALNNEELVSFLKQIL